MIRVFLLDDEEDDDYEDIEDLHVWIQGSQN